MQGTRGGFKGTGMKQAKPEIKAELNLAQIRDDIKQHPAPLPIDMLNDLEECFNHYDEERNGYI